LISHLSNIFFRNKLIQQPFAPLVQEYEKCWYSSTTALENQAGIAVGNVSIFAPFAVILILIFVYFYQLCNGKVISKGYTKVEKDSALEALAVSLLLAKDGKLEYLHRKYNKDLENGTFVDEEDPKKIHDGWNNLELLVKELRVLGNITEKEYYSIRKDEIENEATLVDWKALYNNVSRKGGGGKKGSIYNEAVLNQNSNHRANSGKSAPLDLAHLPPGSSSIPPQLHENSTSSRSFSNNYELTTVNPLLAGFASSPEKQPPQSPASTQASSLNSPSISAKSNHSHASSSPIRLLQILNQTKVNSKERKKYEEFIKGKALQFFSVIYMSTVNKSSFRTVSLTDDPTRKSDEEGRPSIDMAGIRQLSRIIASDSNFHQSLRVSHHQHRSSSRSHPLSMGSSALHLSSTPVVLMSAVPLQVQQTHPNYSLFHELHVAIAKHPTTSRYNPEVMKVMIDYWIPKLDHYFDEFSAMVERIQYVQNNPQSKSVLSAASSSTSFSNSSSVGAEGGVPQDYWVVSSGVSELQLFTLLPKDLLRQYVEELKVVPVEEKDEEEGEEHIGHLMGEMEGIGETKHKQNNENKIAVQEGNDLSSPISFQPISISRPLKAGNANSPNINNNGTPPSSQLTQLLKYQLPNSPMGEKDEQLSEIIVRTANAATVYDCTEEDFQMIFFLLVFYKKLSSLLVVHSMMSLSQYHEETILSQYNRKMAYLIGKDVWTIADLNEWVETFQTILLERDG
jgi:hypothetical protein